jgi:hypothetical protein
MRGGDEEPRALVVGELLARLHEGRFNLVTSTLTLVEVRHHIADPTSTVSYVPDREDEIDGLPATLFGWPIESDAALPLGSIVFEPR